MALPAVDYLNQNTRTEGEMKLALEDLLKGLKQVPGVGVAEQALTLATDVITPAVGASGIISIDTEAAAAADNLANIVLTNVPDGSCLLLRIANNARVVTVKHLAGGSGQLSLRSAADLVMSATTQWLCVKRTGTLLEEQWRSGKEFLKSPTADSLTMTGGINEARGNIAMHATTMNPFAATSPNILDGTGSAVTITDFVEAPQGGVRRTFYPITGTIITHGESITVDGNASYTTQAGDELTLVAATTTLFRVHITKKDGMPVVLSGVSPTVQTFTSGSGTYTTPAGAKAIRVRLVGAGSGGGGGNNATASTAGGNTTFGSLTAGGAQGSSNTIPGAGGTASGGDINAPGGVGAASYATQAWAAGTPGGSGAASPFGGQGAGSVNATGIAAAANSGSGGGGGGSTAVGTVHSGCGGSAGGYVEKWITAPAASYSYAVGAGGAGAAAGDANSRDGAAGGSGRIIVEEYY